MDGPNMWDPSPAVPPVQPQEPVQSPAQSETPDPSTETDGSTTNGRA